MSRVDIKGQVNMRNPIAMYRSTEEAKVDRETTAFSANHPRNWEDFCDGIDSILEDYTRMISSFKRYNIFLQILATVILVLFISTASTNGQPNRIVVMCMLPLVPTLLIFFNYFSCKESSFWKRVEGFCIEKSGDGVRYELLSDFCSQWSYYHVMVHFLNEGGEQNRKTLNDRWALSDPPPTADEEAQNRQTLNDRWGLSDPTPTAPVAPASGETESLFDQLKSS
jgi:hypothetical protein